MQAFRITPDLVTGICTNTLGGRQLIERLIEVPALNLIDAETTPALKSILAKALEMEL